MAQRRGFLVVGEGLFSVGRRAAVDDSGDVVDETRRASRLHSGREPYFCLTDRGATAGRLVPCRTIPASGAPSLTYRPESGPRPEAVHE